MSSDESRPEGNNGAAPSGGDRMIGEVVAGYRLVSRIGAGGMGEVYVAEHLRIDRRVAIKLLLPEMSIRTDMVARFFAEARATSSIRHPGIVEVVDCDLPPGGRAYIVMELLEGQSLRARIAHDPQFGQDERLVLGIGAEIASALAAAHRKNVVHRDLKPDNIFLVNQSRAASGMVVKILDFGIAKLLTQDGADRTEMVRTRTGALLGTPTYMSPEQCRGAAAVDWRADIYALGCILFELLAGRPPFVYAGFGELIAAHIGEPPPSLEGLRPGITPALAALVARLLEKDPLRRPQTMVDVLAEMGALRGQLRDKRSMPLLPESPRGARMMTAASTAGPRGTLLADPAGGAAIKSQTTLSEMAAEETPGPRRRKRWLPILLSALGLGIAGGAVAGLVLYRGQAPIGGVGLRSAGAEPRAAAVPAAVAPATKPAVPALSARAAPDAGAAVVPEAAPGSAPEVVSPAAPATGKPARAHRRRRGAVEERAPLDLDDEERKL